MKYIGIFILIIASFFFGYNVRGDAVVTETKTTTITQVKVDTLVKYYPTPYIVKLSDTLYVSDTILIKETKEYKDSNYYVRISGYSPNIEEIKVYNRNTHTKKEIVRIKRKNENRWGIGITAGYGIGKDGMSPAIVIGLTYRIK